MRRVLIPRLARILASFPMSALIRTFAAASIVFAVFTTGLAGQTADGVYPGAAMTRQQILDSLAGASSTAPAPAGRGREIYASLCARCHMYDDLGTTVGPDLSTVSSRSSRREVLEGILWPSRAVPEPYRTIVFELTDGEFESGIIVREDRTNVYLKNPAYLERPLTLPRARIRSRSTSVASLMPDGLVAALTLQEIDALLGFVLTGK